MHLFFGFHKGKYFYYEHEKLPKNCHGTGDIYASAFVGSLVRGKAPYDAAKIAADYAVECIKATAEEDNHWYGAKFEPVLGKLIKMIEEEEKYQGMVAANIPIHELNQQKEKVNKAYELYLYWLTLSINNLKEVYGIEYAI